jgi:tellurite methyltransferase
MAVSFRSVRRYAALMLREIVSYHLDQHSDWVAELGCGHGQHVRHRPPYQLREWVTQAEGRQARLGSPLDCPSCDRAELPGDVRFERSSVQWTEGTIPAVLRTSHRLAPGTWGLIKVESGKLRFSASTVPKLNLVVAVGSTQPIPPGVDHDVGIIGPVCFSIDFYSVPHDGRPTDPPNERNKRQGSQRPADPASGSARLAHLLCPECGVVLDGSFHASDCRAHAPQ